MTPNNNPTPNSGPIRAFSWNCNGLRAVMRRGDLQKFVAEYRPDILALQEIKLSQDQLRELKLPETFPDYQMFWSFAERKGYAGTALWAKNGLTAKPISLEKHEIKDRYGDAYNEGRLTAVEINGALFVSMYAPNGKEDLSRIPLRVEWDKQMITLLKPYPKVLLMGDFNVANEPIDVANPATKKGKHGFTLEERDGFKNYLKAGYHDIWREENPDKIQYTWWSFRVRNYDPEKPKPGWRIDYALVKGLTAKNAAIHDQIKGSDHCPISINVEDQN